MSAFGISVFGISAFGISAFGISAFGISAFGISSGTQIKQIMILGIILLCVVGGVILSWYASSYNIGHFARNGVKATSLWSFVKDTIGVIFQLEHLKDLVCRQYYTHPGQKYIGTGLFFSRSVLIRDLELIKQVTVKDFDHFTDHFGTIDESVDPLLGSSLFSLKGQKWRDMRATLSPAFTSSKMRNMFQFVAGCAEQTSAFYMKEMQNPQNEQLGHIVVELKDAFRRYANDVIASSAFGVKVDSLSERNNQFYEMGNEATDFTGLKGMKFFLFLIAPKFAKMIGLKVFADKVTNFFRNLVCDSMKAREEGKILRPDMIQLLMEAKKGSLKCDVESDSKDVKEAGFATVEESSVGKETVKRQWTDDELVGQAFIFFFAGFDTSSSVLCFIAHELTVNPDIQEKLQEEIDEVALRNNGHVHYNDLQNMKYMDMVVSETLRLWSPVVTSDRKCVKSYTLPPPTDSDQTANHKGYTIAAGEGISIPVYAIHRDPKYFPNPDKFDPERFSDENKGSIQPFTYMPFGLGPRNCIASRFALMEMKAVIFHMLAKFDFTVISKTQIPLKISKSTFNMTAENGFWIGLKPRVIAGN